MTEWLTELSAGEHITVTPVKLLAWRRPKSEHKHTYWHAFLYPASGRTSGLKLAVIHFTASEIFSTTNYYCHCGCLFVCATDEITDRPPIQNLLTHSRCFRYSGFFPSYAFRSRVCGFDEMIPLQTNFLTYKYIHNICLCVQNQKVKFAIVHVCCGRKLKSINQHGFPLPVTQTHTYTQAAFLSWLIRCRRIIRK